MAQIDLAPRSVVTGRFVRLFAPDDKYTGPPNSGVLQIISPGGVAMEMNRTGYDIDRSGDNIFQLTLDPYNASIMTAAMRDVLVSFDEPGTYTLRLQFLHERGNGGAWITTSTTFTATRPQPVSVEISDRSLQESSFTRLPIFGANAMSGVHGVVKVLINSNEETLIEWSGGSQRGSVTIDIGGPSDSLEYLNQRLASITVSTKKRTRVDVKIHNDGNWVAEAFISLSIKSAATSAPAMGAYFAAGGLALAGCVAAAVRNK